MNGENKISIVVPIYNVEDYIKKCINSIMSQSYENLEIILVDDGSKDGSGKICDEYAEKDERIVVIHKKNGGLSEARNVGIKKATGSLIGFVDGDDYIKKDMYEYLYSLLNTYNADISVCGYAEVINNKIIPNKKKKQDIVYNKEETLRELLKGKIIQDYAWNKLYKKSLFDEVEYPVGKKMEDLGTTYKIIDKSNQIVIGCEEKYFYVQREGSILNSSNSELHIDKYQLGIERYYYIKNKYQNMLENEIDMIERILDLYRIKDNKVENFMEKDEVKLFYKSLLEKNEIISQMPKKMKFKIIILGLSKKIYRML